MFECFCSDLDKMLELFDGVSVEDWFGLIVLYLYMGLVLVFFYVVG